MNALLTVEEAAAVLRCRRTRVFELLAEGVLQRAERYGRKTVVTSESVEAACQAVQVAAPRRRRMKKKDLAAEFDAVLARSRRETP